MIKVNELLAQSILNLTSINLGEYVINPYFGCEFSCLYCYVRSNKAVTKKNKIWGEFLDVRINAPEQLEKEIITKRPNTVLLGSTTECFQPIEEKYHITEKILNILNNHKIFYVILTRSPLIVNYMNILSKGYCKKIYFTINDFEQKYKDKFEPKSPEFINRIEAINKLADAGISIVPYFSPIMPFISDLNNIFFKLKNISNIEFECLNFNLKNINEIFDKIGEIDPLIKEKYMKIYENKQFYDKVWEDIEAQVNTNALNSKVSFHLHKHQFGNYFENKY